MKIKVCGMTSFEQMQQLQDLGVDYAGMIFYESSGRFAADKMKDEKLKIKNLEIKKVGVFVNADIKTVEKAIDDFGLDAVQLHGDETAEFCKALRNKVKLIKVFRITGKEKIEELVRPFQKAADYFLFDTNTEAYGGSGKQFDWDLVRQSKISKPFFLSGGIGLEDAEKLKLFEHPDFYAVDVNSRFETGPGNKDVKRVAQFVQLINHG